jgi:VanZ family protein
MNSGKIIKISFFIFALLILILSLLPYTPAGFGQLSDKATHLIAYSVLACSFIFAFSAGKIHFILLSFISITVCTLYGGLIEILQNFTHRSPELLDFLADFLGSVTGTLIAAAFIVAKRKWQNNR